MPIDPDADPSRKAWKPKCPNCLVVDCEQCNTGRNCDFHWAYLLRNSGRVIYLQCHRCAHMWSVRTERGAA